MRSLLQRAARQNEGRINFYHLYTVVIKTPERNSGYLLGETWKPLIYQADSTLKFSAPSLCRKIALVEGHVVISGTAIAPTGENSGTVDACIWIDGEITYSDPGAWLNFNCVAPLN